MSEFVIQIVARIVITGLLTLVIGLCASQIYRIWFDKTIVLNPFSYLKANDSSTTAGLYFTNLVSPDLLRLRSLYAPDNSGLAEASKKKSRVADRAAAEIPSISFLSENALPFDLPRMSVTPFSSIDISAYGVKFSEIFKGFARWIEQPYAIDGTVSEFSGRVRVTATLQNPPGRASPIHWSFEEKDAEGASFQLACQILQMLTAPHAKVIKETPPVEFCAFTKAWRDYQAFRQELGISPDLERNEKLTKASQLVEGLTSRNSQLPYVYKLAALVFQEQRRAEDAVRAIGRYRELIAENDISDAQAERLEASLKRLVEASAKLQPPTRTTEDLNLRGRKRPVQPGFSASSKETTAGTICCVVQDASQVKYLLSAEHVFRGKVGERVIQPGVFDGGVEDDAVAAISAIIAPGAGAQARVAGVIARLLPNVEANATLPGIGRIAGVGRTVALNETVRMVGRTTGLATGKVTAIDVNGVAIHVGTGVAHFSGLIQTTAISQAGDSGAPVVNERNELIGMVYAGSSTQTLILPIGRVLEAFKVSLVQ